MDEREQQAEAPQDPFDMPAPPAQALTLPAPPEPVERTIKIELSSLHDREDGDEQGPAFQAEIMRGPWRLITQGGTPGEALQQLGLQLDAMLAASAWERAVEPDRQRPLCRLCQVPLDAVLATDLVSAEDPDGTVFRFCSLRCARSYRKARP